MDTILSPKNLTNSLSFENSPLFPNTTFQQSELWVAIYNRLLEILDSQEFEYWIKPLQARQISQNEIIVTVPNLVFYQGLSQVYFEKITAAKNHLGFNAVSIQFEIPGNNMNNLCQIPADPIINPEDFSVEDTEELQNKKSSDSEDSFTASSTPQHLQLNPLYRFDTFVRGESNQFAHASCLAVAEAPGKTYNPLFIYGSTGLGKTHLLHAVGARILEANPRTRIIYVQSERFTNEMITCIRFNKMWDFRKKYRNCDVFLVDDIQFISGKGRSQEEFFHTFNTLYEAKKQIVITSDLFPQDIPEIEDRLRNRFQWGLIADIQPPSVEHRVAILMKKASLKGKNLDESVALYIANHTKKNVRELEGALNRLIAFSTLHGRPINLELAAETFQNVLSDAPKRLSIEQIQKVVAEHYKVKTSDLKSKKKQRTLTVPRQIAMYLSRVRTPASFPDIGSKFGGKDHTTVIHAVRKIEAERLEDLDLKTSIEALERKLDQIS